MYLAAPSEQLQIPSNDWTITYDTIDFQQDESQRFTWYERRQKKGGLWPRY